MNIKNFTLLLSFLFLSFHLQAQWELMNTIDQEVFISDLSVVNENVAWAVGPARPPNNGNGYAYKTLDGGMTWDILNLPEPTDLWMIEAVNDSLAFIGTVNFFSGGQSKILRTQDGGITWETLNVGAGINFNAILGIHFYNNEEGFAIMEVSATSNRMQLFQTFDGGNTWTENTEFPTTAEDYVLMFNGTHGIETSGDAIWVGSQRGVLFHSKDRGESWELITSPLFPNEEISSYSFKDEMNGLVLFSGNGFVIYNGGTMKRRCFRTADGGINWEEISIPNDCETIEFIPGTEGAYTATQNGTSGKYYYHLTNDDGNNWSELESAKLNSIEFISDSIAFAGAYKQIFKWSGDPINQLDLSPVVHEVPYLESFENGHPKGYEFNGFMATTLHPTIAAQASSIGVEKDSGFAGMISNGANFNYYQTEEAIETCAIHLADEDKQYTLNYDAYFTNTGDEIMNVSISKDNKSTWEPIEDLANTAANDWISHEVDLSAYAGDTIYISFSYFDNFNAFGFFIDEISVSENTSVSNKDLVDENQFNLFPNPVSSNLFINYEGDESDLVNIQLFNTSNQLITTKKVSLSNQMDLDVRELSSGLYWLIVSTKTSKEVLSFVKQ